MFETPTLAAIMTGVRQEWVQTVLGIGPVEIRMIQNYIHKFYNFLRSLLFNHKIISSCVHFAIKLPNGIALSVTLLVPHELLLDCR